MLALTEAAQLAIHALVDPADASGSSGIRIAATPSPDGQEPHLDLEIRGAADPGDHVVEVEGAKVFLDETAMAVLADQTLDVSIDMAAEQVNFFLVPRSAG